MTAGNARIRDYAIIGLLVLNLAATAYLVFRQPAASAGAPAKALAAVDITEAEAMTLANELVGIYNDKDNSALFERFDGLAKAQLTREQLDQQMAKLYPLMGSISDPAFSNAVLAATEGNREFYHLTYKVRLSGGPFSAGEMKLTVTRRDNGLGLMGFFVNGTSQQTQ
jgi:hypothetical protein